MLIIDASPEMCGHLATALHLHQQWVRTAGLTMPADLVEFKRICVSRARKGQAGTPLEDMWELREAETVTRQLVPYEDAATVLSCSVRHVKRLVADGLLPAVRVGSASVVRIRITDLQTFINRLSGKEMTV